MKRISDYKGEEALDLLADIIESLAFMFADDEIQRLVKSKAPKIKYVKPLIKNHKKEIIEVLARIEGVSSEEYVSSVTVATLPIQITSLLSDPQMADLFTLQGQKTELPSSGPATEGTTEDEN